MSNNSFNINEVRIFTVPNLLATATVVQAPEPKDPLFKAENLVENPSTRSGRQDLNAIIAWDGVTVTRASFSSCFVTTNTQLVAEGHNFVMVFDLLKSISIEGFILVQDLYNGNGDGHTDQK